MALEIERKFLIKNIPFDITKFPHREIMQGYFLNSENKEIRLRKKGSNYFKTRKSGSGLVREENEIPITLQEFKSQRKKVGNRYLKKNRYEIPYQSKFIELDVYQGSLIGLLVAEVEFTSVDEAHKFVIPDRFDVEVTDVEEAHNYYLAKNGISLKLKELMQ